LFIPNPENAAFWVSQSLAEIGLIAGPHERDGDLVFIKG
jgi:hypothetical protein